MGIGYVSSIGIGYRRNLYTDIMKDGKYSVEDINRFYKDGMFYFIMASYISAEYLVEEENYKTAYLRLSSIIECLPDSCLPEKEKEENIGRAKTGIENIIKPEYKEKFGKEFEL